MVTSNLGMQAARAVVSYHYPCPDGIFAALAAHLHFAQHKQPVRWVPNTVYRPWSVQQMNLQVGLGKLLLRRARLAAGVAVLQREEPGLQIALYIAVFS